MKVTKKLYAFLCVILVNYYYSQPIVSVDNPNRPQSSYSVENLIKKVLVSGVDEDCIIISNVKFSAKEMNLPFKNYGYFHKEDTNFPFKEGLVLSTGRASLIGNTPSYPSNNSWDEEEGIITGGDADLAA
ncbi:MAG: hypothetical protein LBQ84_03730, partial [Flavobacteriaceae bacterium]|nr:hypothetical protein [Flavobacteriaceae bacterium]